MQTNFPQLGFRPWKVLPVIVIVFLSGIAHFSNAQTPAYINYSSDDVLPTNVVFDVIQDKDGTLIFGTQLGMYRFDGRNFTIIPFSMSKSQTTTTFELRKSPSGDIWAQFMGGGFYPLKDGVIQVDPPTNNELEKGYLHHHILNYYPTDTGAIWFVQKGHINQVSIVDKDGKLDSILCDHSHSDSEAFHLYRIPETRRFLGLQCDESSGSNGEASQLPPTELMQASELGWTIRIDQWPDSIPIRYLSNLEGLETSTHTWFTVAEALIIKDKSTGKEKHVSLVGSASKLDTLNDGRVCISTHRGLYLCAPDGSDIELLFKGHLVMSCLQDLEGGLWVTTQDKGIFYCPSLRVRTLDVPEMENTDFSMLSKKENGPLAALSSNLDLYLLNRNGKGWSLDFYPENEYRKTVDVQIPGGSMTFANDRLQIGNFYFDLNTQKFNQVHPNWMNDVAVVDGQLFGVNQQGVFNLRSGEALAIPEERRQFRTSVHGNKKRLYIGGTNTLDVFHLPEGPYEANVFRRRKSLEVNNILPLNAKTFVLSGSKGLFLIREDTLQQIPLDPDGTSPICWSTCIESETVIWAGTTKGVYRVELNGEDYIIDKLEPSNGLTPKLAVQLEHDNDTLYVATQRGIRMIKTANWTRPSQQLNLRLSSVQINDSVVPFEGSLLLDKESRNVRFNFSVPTFRPQMNLEYSYRLLGFHDNWVNSTENFAAYFNLPPGEYTFEARARSGKKPWTTVLVNVPVSVPPTLIETSSFWVLFSIIFALIVTGVLYWFFKSRDQKRKANWSYSNARLQALGLQMNPHFLFNALNNIQALSYSGNHLKMNTFISQLAGLTRQVLDHSERPLINLGEELYNVEQYLTMEKIRFENKPFEWSIEVEESINQEATQIPPMLLQPIVENAIWHGLLNKEGNRTLHLRCFRNNSGYSISITDNGIGYDTEKPKTVGFKPSISLDNIRKRLELYNRLNYGTASFDIKSRKDASATSGTEATFVFETQTVAVPVGI